MLLPEFLVCQDSSSLQTLATNAAKGPSGNDDFGTLIARHHTIAVPHLRLLRPLKIDRLEHVEETSALSASTTWRLQPIFTGLEASTSSHISKMFYDLGRALAHSLVNEIKRAQASSKVDFNEMFSLITFLVERAAQMRSIRLNVRGAEDGADGDARMREESLRDDEDE